jgi:leader peptidase (prepilin peptidase) / N-methyltransferase
LYLGEKTLSEYLASIPPFFFFIFGAIFGSFANVVIYRLPKGESISFPGSHCYSCKKPVRWFHNIPIFSWFLLKGKCADCKAPFSFRYPLVEFLMGLVFYLAFYFYGWNWQLLEILIFLFGLVTVSFIDLDHYILPDVFTLSGIVIGLVGALLNPERSFLDALLGVLIGGGFLWAIAYFYFVFRKEEGMGGGDIKLLAWMGAVLGWKAIPFVIITSSVVGSLGGIWVALKQKKGMKAAIPFGPYLALGAVAYLFGGQEIASWYLKLFIPGVD